MSTARRVVVTVSVAAAAREAFRRRAHMQKLLRRANATMARRRRYFAGLIEGDLYRAGGNHPDPDVDDSVLADRVRSMLGPIEKRLDVPHVHVMCEDHVVLLHGDVGSDNEADRIERMAEKVSGVRGVRSFLHVGLLAGDSRPSEGAAHQGASDALRRFIDAAVGATGYDEPRATQLVGVTLGIFGERLPRGERSHLISHLPSDVRALISPRSRRHEAVFSHLEQMRTESEIVLAVASVLDDDDLRRIRLGIETTVATLRELVPEERLDVAAVLPPSLRELWTRSVPV
jgi:uncharacterized protein (DUF2267 family)